MCICIYICDCCAGGLYIYIHSLAWQGNVRNVFSRLDLSPVTYMPISTHSCVNSSRKLGITILKWILSPFSPEVSAKGLAIHCASYCSRYSHGRGSLYWLYQGIDNVQKPLDLKIGLIDLMPGLYLSSQLRFEKFKSVFK